MAAVTARKKPIEIRAVRWLGNNTADLFEFAGGHIGLPFGAGNPKLWVEKSATWVELPEGTWIIAEPDGNGFYPCTAKDFVTTYDIVGQTRVDL